MVRGINLSAAIIVLICFFLPWVQVSCGGASDNLSGLALARDGHPTLWLVPILMLAVLTVGLLRAWTEQPKLAAIVCILSGVLSALLMNRERARVHDSSGLLSPQLTGWFWLSLISAVAIVLSGLVLLLGRRGNIKNGIT